jgi:hypothetical protein
MGITVLVPASQSHANAKHIANSNLSNISFPLYSYVPLACTFSCLHTPPKLGMALPPPVVLCGQRVQRRSDTRDGRAPALTASGGDRVPPRRLRLLVTCLGMVEERAAERDIVDRDGCLLFICGKEE